MAKPQAVNLGTQKAQRALAGENVRLDKKTAEAISASQKPKLGSPTQPGALPQKLTPSDTATAPTVTAPPAETFLPSDVQYHMENDQKNQEQFWKTNEFQNYVMSLRRSDAANTETVNQMSNNYQDAAVRSNTLRPPIPVTNPKPLSSSQTSIFAPSLFGKSPTEAKAIMASKNLPQNTDGVNPNVSHFLSLKLGTVKAEDIAAQAQAKTDALLKQPRTYFLPDGTPIQTDAARSYDMQKATLQQAYAGDPVRLAFETTKLNVASFLGGAAKFVAGPAAGVMEWATNPHPSLPAAVIQTTANAIMAGASGLNWLGTQIFSNDQMPSQLRQTADNIQENLLNGTFGLKESNAMKSAIQNLNARADFIENQRATNQQNWITYSNGVKRSWANLMGAKDNPLVMPVQPSPGIGKGAEVIYQKKLAEYKAAQAQATFNANAYHQTAVADYQRATETNDTQAAKVLANSAVQNQTLSVKERAKLEGGAASVYGSYTWASEPQKEEQFYTAVGLFELQKGSQATIGEIQDIKDHYVNPWTDGIGQAIFDPLWLLPAEVMEKAFGAITFPITEGFKGLRTFEPFDNLYKLAFDQAYSSVANQIGRKVSDTFNLMRQGYGSNATFIEDVDAIGDLVKTVDRYNAAGELTLAREAFDAAKGGGKGQIAGLQQLTYEEFSNKLIPAVKDKAGDYLIDPSEWGNILKSAKEDAIAAHARVELRAFLKSGMPIDEATAKAEQAATEFVQDSKKSGIYIDFLRSKMERAFLDPHRAYKGSRLIDDTISGWIAKKVVQAGNQKGAEVLDTTLGVLMGVRNIWTTAVLNLNPARVIRNLFDSMGRDVVYGGSIIDDMDTLLRSTHWEFANDVGFIPIEFGQSLARSGLDFGDAVPAKLLFSDNKPRWGVLSYWADEVDRLKGKALEKSAEDAEIATGIARQMTPQSQSVFGKLYDGFKTGLGEVGYGLKAIPAGLADYNTAIEFTLRLRMFHREYFKVINNLSASLFADASGALTSDAAKQIAKEAWEIGRSNPAKMGAYIDSITKGAEDLSKSHPSWSVLFPEDFGKGVGDESFDALFTHNMRSNIEGFIDSTAKVKGRAPTAEEFGKYIDDAKSSLEKSFQESISNTFPKREAVPGDISTEVTHQPEMSELNGSAPVASTKAQTYKPAPEIKTIGQRRAVPADINEAYKTAMEPYANVTNEGKGVQSFVDKNTGEVRITIGDDALHLNRDVLRKQLHEATLDAYAKGQEEFITKTAWDNISQWKQSVKDFLADPMKVRNEIGEDLDKAKRFTTIVRQMEENPDLYNILRQTNPGVVKDYTEAAVNLRKYGYLPFMSEMPRGDYVDYLGNVTKTEQLVHPHSPAFTIAGSNAADARGDLTKAILDSGDQELIDLNQKLQEQYSVIRYKWETDYTRTGYPGPEAPGISGRLKGQKWDESERWRTYGYVADTDRFSTWNQMVKTDPEGLKKLLTDIGSDRQKLTNFILESRGISVQLDDAGHVIGGTAAFEGRTHDLTSMEKISLENMFYKKNMDGTYGAVRAIDPLDQTVTIHHQLWTELQNIGLPPRDSAIFARSMETESNLWANLTGLPVEDYYKRIGFEKVGAEAGFTFKGQSIESLINKGLVTRDPTGRIMFYASGSDTSSFLHQSTKLFYADLVDIAEHNTQYEEMLKTVNKALGVPEGVKVLSPDQEAKWADIFTSYAASGKDPTGKLIKPLEGFSKRLARTYEGIQSVQGVSDLDPALREALDSVYIHNKMVTPPSSAKRVISTMAQEAGIDPVKVNAQALEEANRVVWEARRTELTDLLNKAKTKEEFAPYQDELRVLDEYFAPSAGAEAVVPPRAYSDLSDVPDDVLQKVVDKYKTKAETAQQSLTLQRLDEAHKVLVKQPEFANMSPDVLKDRLSLKNYLKEQMVNPNIGPEGRQLYNNLLWQVEQTEHAILNFHSGDKMADILAPRISEFQVNRGIKTWMRNNTENLSNFEGAMRELDRLKTHLQSGNATINSLLTDDVKKELMAWRDTAVTSKANLVNIGLNGGTYNGRTIQGAIDKTNWVMLDYNYRTRFDNVMRNIFPFWQFPSRSFPFWTQTLITHPEIVAAYQKLRNLSLQTAYQAGAVSSSGKVLPSMEGYIPVPGTNLWFNPIAPFSFSYVLGMGLSPDDVTYDAQNEDNVSPESWMAKEFMSMSPIYGFSPGPWVGWLVKGQFGIPDSVLPPWPIIPQISLIPRWMEQDLIDKANRFNFLGGTGWGDKIAPQVSWHDFLVERQMLTELNAELDNMNNVDALHQVNSVAAAIQQKGTNALWQKAVVDYTNGEWSRTTGSFFTGFYTKPFTDMDAELLSLRNQNNLLKSSLNNRFQAAFFELPTNADDAWNKYLNTQNVPEGWLYRLYTDIGYVRNDSGMTVTDPVERAKLLAVKIQDDENQSLYYQQASNFQNEYNRNLRSLGIGAPYDKVKAVTDKYYNDLASIAYLNTYTGGFPTNKPADLIAKDLANRFYRAAYATHPNYDPTNGESFQTYQQHVSQWEANLPQLGKTTLRYITMQKDINSVLTNLRPDQQLPPNFFQSLADGLNVQTLKQWQMDNDNILDAANTAWKNIYYDPYYAALLDHENYTLSSPNDDKMRGGFNAVYGFKKGAAAELAQYDFLKAHPNPPSAEELYVEIQRVYGDRFSLGEVQQLYNSGSTDPIWDMDKRLIEANGPDYQLKQGMWDILNFASAGKSTTILQNSMPPVERQYLEQWYTTGGNMPADKINKLNTALQRAAGALGLTAPSRDLMVAAVKAQDANKQFQEIESKRLGVTWSDLSDTLNEYYTEGYKKFRNNYPEDYKVIQKYFNDRTIFSKQNADWSAIYAPDITPNIKSTSPIKPPSSLAPAYDSPKSGVQYPAGLVYPAGMQTALPTEIVKQINNRYVKGGELPVPTKVFLYGLKRRHPDWAAFIDGVAPPRGQ